MLPAYLVRQEFHPRPGLILYSSPPAWTSWWGLRRLSQVSVIWRLKGQSACDPPRFSSGHFLWCSSQQDGNPARHHLDVLIFIIDDIIVSYFLNKRLVLLGTLQLFCHVGWFKSPVYSGPLKFVLFFSFFCCWVCSTSVPCGNFSY